MIKTCLDYDLDDAPDCCESCHQDDYEGIFPLSDEIWGEGLRVCCTIGRWLLEKENED